METTQETNGNLEQSQVQEQDQSYSIDYDIITGKVELNESQAITVLMQLWDNAIKAGVVSAQDTVLIHKAIKLVSERLLPAPPEPETQP
jgi:hypothetical protein